MQSMYVSMFPSCEQNLIQRPCSISSYSGDFSRDPYFQQSMYSSLQGKLRLNNIYCEGIITIGVGYDWTSMSNYPNDQFPPNPETPMIPTSNSPLHFNGRQRDNRQNFLSLQSQQVRSISPAHQMGSFEQQSSLGTRGGIPVSSASLPAASPEPNLRRPYPVGMAPTSMQTPAGQYIPS